MPRKKKSRKVGQIGTPKTSHNIHKDKEKRVKKPKGKPAGNRNSEAKTTNNTSSNQQAKDPRHGSKKPVDLFAKSEKKKSTPKVKHFSPAIELEAIEKDTRLANLLDKSELGKKLSLEDQHFVDTNLARHKELCKMLGIEEDVEQSDTPEEPDNIFGDFDSISMDDYKD